jgi:glutamate--cysteine ligase
LLKDSPIICTREQVDIDANDQLVAHEGRKENLLLQCNKQKKTLQNWGSEIATEMLDCAQLFGDDYVQEIAKITMRFDLPETTPSGIIKKQMLENNQGFFDYINTFAQKYQQHFMKAEINQAHFDYLDAQAKLSCQKQKNIEQADKINFDDYLKQYFQ